MVFAVALSMLAYGIGKYWQFGIGREMDIHKPVSELSGMELMWAFYGYSDTYPLILGIAEILGALLLVLPKTRLLGGFLLSTLLVNIIIQDVIYGVLWGALMAACIYQTMLLLIFWMHRNKLLSAYRSLLPDRSQAIPLFSLRGVVFLALAGLLAIFLKYLEIFGPRWFH